MTRGREVQLSCSSCQLADTEDGDPPVYFDVVVPRGFSMRRGHRRRLARECGRESRRGRATFGRSLNRDRIENHGGDDAWTRRHGQAKQVLREQDLDFEDLLPDSSFWVVSSQISAGRCPKKGLGWEAAQRRAEEITKEYSRSFFLANRLAALARRLVKKVRGEDAHADKAVLHAGGRPKRKPRPPKPLIPLSCAPHLPREQQQGKPSKPFSHRDVLAVASSTYQSVPSCWYGGLTTAGRFDVQRSSLEYRAVTGYFLDTLGMYADIESLTRLQLPDIYNGYASVPGGDQEETVMFHGCKSETNERSILAQGFQVSCCISRGRNFGTWLAYDSNYSHNGYVYQEPQTDIRHIFLCVVRRRYVVLDNCTMRVVGQDCAYPLWLLRYSVTGSVRVSLPVAPVAPIAATTTRRAAKKLRKERRTDAVRDGLARAARA